MTCSSCEAAFSSTQVLPFSSLVALVDQQGHVTAVVDHQFRAGQGAVGQGEGQRVQGAVPVLFQRFALPGEHGGAGGGDRRGGVVLGREDVARGPAHVGADVLQGLDQHRGLDGHVQRAGNAHALQRQLGLVLAADGHQARHFVLGDVQFLAAPVGQGDIADLVIAFGGEGLGNSIHAVAPVVGERMLASGRAPLLQSHLAEPGRSQGIRSQRPSAGEDAHYIAPPL